jgi:hypothetical protein
MKDASMTGRDKDKKTKRTSRGDRYAKDRKYLIGLVHKLEDDEGLDRLFKAAMHLQIQSTLVAFDGSLSVEAKSAAVLAMGKAIEEIAKAAGIPVADIIERSGKRPLLTKSNGEGSGLGTRRTRKLNQRQGLRTRR